MQPQTETIVELEEKFWQAMVDNDSDTAVGMLADPSLIVSSEGSMKVGHEQYREMAEKGQWILKSYELSDMKVLFPNERTAVCTYHARQTVGNRGEPGTGTVQEMNDSSTWVKDGDAWKCVMHTETPAGRSARH